MRSLVKAVLVLGLLVLAATPARAAGPDREEIVEQDCIVYVWNLMAWKDLQPACSFWLYNEGIPTGSEVAAFCGPELSTAWYQTAPISPGQGAPNSGYYLLLDKLVFTTCKTSHSLPPVNFSYTISSNILEITATETIPGHSITSIYGNYGGHPFECLGDQCQITVYPTGPRGIEATWQAVSTFSDKPTPSQAIYIKYKPPATPEVVDSDHGTAAQRLWGSFIDPAGPEWMAAAAQPSSEGFAYLAGRIIGSGLVDPGDCHNSGLMANGYASVCGLDKAWDYVLEYQNRTDDQITQAAARYEIPGQLLKRLIAIESQFWPDQHINWGAAGEAGLGQLTHNGADTLLIWDKELYQAVCAPLFGSECGFSYTRLDGWQQAALQNEIMKNPDLDILARALRANAAQTGAIIREITGNRPGALMDHQDLWRAALVNYNSGPGCLRAGLRDMLGAGYIPSWGSLATSLEAVCPGSTVYVERVTSNPLPYQPKSE